MQTRFCNGGGEEAERKRQLGSPKCRRESDIKVGLQEVEWRSME